MSQNIIIDKIIESTEMFCKTRGNSVKGQFFTPSSIAKFMAQLCHIEKKQTSVKILDPGAGTGILTASLCLELAKSNQINKINKIQADLYENDKDLFKILSENMLILKKELLKKGIVLKFNIISDDFILDNLEYWHGKENTKNFSYDIAIANPPYFKLSKDNKLAIHMSSIVHGQPNIYVLFMAMAAKLLKKNGQLIFITPRSYCSGLYFKVFRKWFFSIMKPQRIHIFESRKKAFDNEVLQETIILKAIKTSNASTMVNVSSSFDAYFTTNYKEFKNILFAKIFSDTEPESFLKIPTSKEDIEILDYMSNWQDTLVSIGFKLSTGPVVDFRSKDFLGFNKNFDEEKIAPLFWMHNLNGGFTVKWIKNKNKASTIKITKKSLNRLVINKNYVFLKRFTSKEQPRRIYASVYLASSFKTDYIGIENHLNYIWKTNNQNMSESEAWGLATFLNSSFVDKYFRIISGSTQVNATEINNMPMPTLEQITIIGELAIKKKLKKYEDIASIVNEVLKIKKAA